MIVGTSDSVMGTIKVTQTSVYMDSKTPGIERNVYNGQLVGVLYLSPVVYLPRVRVAGTLLNYCSAKEAE